MARMLTLTAARCKEMSFHKCRTCQTLINQLDAHLLAFSLFHRPGITTNKPQISAKMRCKWNVAGSRLSALGGKQRDRDGKSFVCAGIYIIALQWLAFGLPPPVNAMTNRLKVPQRTPRTRHVLLLFPIQFWGGAAAGKKLLLLLATCKLSHGMWRSAWQLELETRIWSGLWVGA